MPQWISKLFRWSKTSYVFLSGFLLLLFLIGYVWRPLLHDYLNQFNPDLPVWQQVDWLLIGNFGMMSLLIMINADIKHDFPFALIALVGGFIIEAWGTLSGLWTYYTFETPPLWIIPAWPIAALSVNRLYMISLHPAKKVSDAIFSGFYWPVFFGFYILLWRFAWPGLSHPLTWFALAFCGVIIASGQDKRSAVLIFVLGSGLGYFLERWGTTRLCWAYHTGGFPPLITVFSHGMASVAIWRVYQVYKILVDRSRVPWTKRILPLDE